ncbi:FAD-dependent monooxygenase [Streptosporangiaceae bacterium NEAU-GS5]|nr:FAD-dependent monooxygenase [Streptosporangiaceae bacterium NEAU-GS5]
MAHILILGAGLAGLTTGTMLARDGHRVTVLERDLAGPPERAEEAWTAWERRGVNQFRLPHMMLPRWWSVLRTELPEVRDPLLAAGARRLNVLAELPEARRGALRAEDDRFETVTARRPVLEAALARAAEAAGVTIRRGVTVTGVTTEPAQVPHVTGVLTADGRAVHADLVVDCGGRRSALPAWLRAAGARPPLDERADSGFVYYGRHFRSRTGEQPAALMNYLQNYDSVSIITLPSDGSTWSLVITTSARDKKLRALRDPDRWHAALAGYPLVAHWADGEPISGVDVMAGIEDRYRHLVVDGTPVATGVVAVGDSCAATNPSVGRGASMAIVQGRLLRDLLRETDPQDHDKLARRFGEDTAKVIEPMYQTTLWGDRHRLAEIEADAAGHPYHPDDLRWHVAKAMFAASLTDPELARAYTSIAAFIAAPSEVMAIPAVRERMAAFGAEAPRYPLPGLSRAELLERIG